MDAFLHARIKMLVIRKNKNISGVPVKAHDLDNSNVFMKAADHSIMTDI